MDSSRISQFFGLAPKMANPADSAPADKGGFADLLFGVMSKRISTAKPTLTATRVSTILPVGDNAVATTLVSRKPEATRLSAVTGTARNGEVPAAKDEPRTDTTAKVAADKSMTDKSMADKSVADKSKTRADAVVDGRGDIGDAAPPAEGAEIGDEGGDERDLQAEAEGNDGENGNIGQDGTEQPLDQQAATAVIEPLAVPADSSEIAAPIQMRATTGVPSAAGEESAAPVLPAAQPAMVSAEEATPQLPEAASNAQSGVAAETPAESETVAAQAVENKPADGQADQATAALALATDPLADEAKAQAAILARQNERRNDDAAGIFRRPAQTPRQRAAAASTGAAGAPTQSPANSGIKTTAPIATATTTTTAPTTILPLAPMGFDTGLGTVPGMPGWTLNLAQGAVTRRPDFIANLRQHLQNLPAHEQMALGIQRSARDGGGRITLQLSPTELGRIHLKLDIDEEKNVRASVSVERPATLELLQRDTKALERALQDAGLKMDQSDLSFSLHGGDGDSFAREFGGEGRDLAALLTDGAENEIAPDVTAQAAVISTGDGLVDVQI